MPFQGGFSFSQRTIVEYLNDNLVADIVKKIISFPLMTCNICLDSYQKIPLFQEHINNCRGPPLFEFQTDFR